MSLATVKGELFDWSRLLFGEQGVGEPVGRSVHARPDRFPVSVPSAPETPVDPVTEPVVEAVDDGADDAAGDLPPAPAGHESIDVLTLITGGQSTAVAGAATATSTADGLLIEGEDAVLTFDTSILPADIDSPADLTLALDATGITGDVDIAIIDADTGQVLTGATEALTTGTLTDGVTTVAAGAVPLARPAVTPLRTLLRVTLVGASSVLLRRARVTHS